MMGATQGGLSFQVKQSFPDQQPVDILLLDEFEVFCIADDGSILVSSAPCGSLLEE
jgi:hypothetical protein